MKTLIRMIKPSILRKLVIPYSDMKQVKLRIKVDHRLKFNKYLTFLQQKLDRSDSGYSHLVKFHTEITTLSEDFLKWFKPEESSKLNAILEVGEQDHSLRKR